MATYVFIESREHYRRYFNKAVTKGFVPSKHYGKHDGVRMPVKRRPVAQLRPQIIFDRVEYMSPMEDGKLITGRRQRREDMAKHGMVPWEPINNRPRGYADRKFCKANNLPHSEAAEEWLGNEKKKTSAQLAQWRKIQAGEPVEV